MYKDKSIKDTMIKKLDDTELEGVSGGSDNRDYAPGLLCYHCDSCGKDTEGELGGLDEDGNRLILCTYCHAPL